MPRARLLVTLLTVLIALAAAGRASAQSPLDGARGHFEQAEFEAALSELDRVEEGDGLTREQLLELLRLRILVELGMGDDGGVRTDVRRLLSLDPDHRLGDSMPPEVHEAAEAIRAELGGVVSVEVEAGPTPTGVRLDAEVRNDPTSLVRQVIVHGRVAHGRWQRAAPPLTLAPGPGTSVAFWAEAVGPGGAVVATDGSSEVPSTFTTAAEDDDGGDQGGGNTLLWVGIGAGGAALVAGAIVTVGLLSGSAGVSDTTNPSFPTLIVGGG